MPGPVRCGNCADYWPSLLMIWVFDRQGTFIDGSIQDDPQDALLAVSERLLPPQKPSE